MKEVCGEHSTPHSDACFTKSPSFTSGTPQPPGNHLPRRRYYPVVISAIQSQQQQQQLNKSTHIHTHMYTHTPTHSDPFTLPAAAAGSLNYATTPVECCSDV